jgi:hypothetical protein
LGRGLDKGVGGTRGLVWSGYLGVFNPGGSRVYIGRGALARLTLCLRSSDLLGATDYGLGVVGCLNACKIRLDSASHPIADPLRRGWIRRSQEMPSI